MFIYISQDYASPASPLNVSPHSPLPKFPAVTPLRASGCRHTASCCISCCARSVAMVGDSCTDSTLGDEMGLRARGSWTASVGSRRMGEERLLVNTCFRARKVESSSVSSAIPLHELLQSIRVRRLQIESPSRSSHLSREAFLML